MDSVVLLYKKAGETPLSCLSRWKEDNPQYQHIPATYAGRLDPMAEGLILILYGDTVNEKDHYLHLDKKYVVDILFGITSDTGDVLGIPTHTQKVPLYDIKSLTDRLNSLVPTILGIQEQAYPPYSSKPINGKPLFWWARKNLLHIISIPQHQIIIHSITIENVTTITGENLLHHIRESVSRVDGDFRQKDISEAWSILLEPYKNILFPIARLAVHSSSGTYMRVLAEDIGKKLNQDALALSIKRIAIGNYTIPKQILETA